MEEASLLRDAGIPVARFLTLHRAHRHSLSFEEVERQLGLPCFVKPANLGSSVGIHKVRTSEEFSAAVSDAFSFDHKILIEGDCAGGKWDACAVLGNDSPRASVPGDVLPLHDFYSYDAEYIDENGAALKIPADIPAEIAKEIQRRAVETFQVLCCQGMARVDFFLRGDNEILVNEINTIPGFTKISMYPKTIGKQAAFRLPI